MKPKLTFLLSFTFLFLFAGISEAGVRLLIAKKITKTILKILDDDIKERPLLPLVEGAKFAAEGNEIIVFDYPEGFREPASFYTATLDDQGKVIEVDDSRKVTFSEWNSKSTEERKEITAEVRRQDKTFCQYQQRTLPPDFFARYEPCPDKQLWVP